jgi:hypothetical protein
VWQEYRIDNDGRVITVCPRTKQTETQQIEVKSGALTSKVGRLACVDGQRTDLQSVLEAFARLLSLRLLTGEVEIVGATDFNLFVELEQIYDITFTQASSDVWVML